MKTFHAELERWQAGRTSPKRWVFVPYDQLTADVGPLSEGRPEDTGIVMVENAWKAGLRPYHKQKLAFILANMRHFALERAKAGHLVRYEVGWGPYREILGPIARDIGPLIVMEPAERELRVDLQPLVNEGALEVVPHVGWLTSPELFEKSQRGGRWRMDAFYRAARKQTGILMENGKPVGGKLSFDTENRKAWRGTPEAPKLPVFDLDPIKAEVSDLIESRFAHHPGMLNVQAYPVTADEHAEQWRWFLDQGLVWFGPYQDAMAEGQATLFHARISGSLHLHRLRPERVINDVLALDAPLASQEGFIRQILGWREFVRHVHRSTDGFRILDGETVPQAKEPADAGWARFTGKPWGKVSAKRKRKVDRSVEGLGGAGPNHLKMQRPLPVAFWGVSSGLHCLDTVVKEVWADGYGHHITRLMVLSNVATLLDVEPRDLTDWFWVAYHDAFDWVVEPNVLGMGTFSIGDKMTTKPYVAGSAYIDKMSDYCKSCAFNPKSTCPIRSLYWAFLDRHRETLETNPRLRMPYRSLDKMAKDTLEGHREMFDRVARALDAGERVALPTPAKRGRK